MDIDWINKGLQVLLYAGSAFGVVKTYNYFVARDKYKAESEVMRADAEEKRAGIAQKLLDGVMAQLNAVTTQLGDVRNENMAQQRDMASMRIHHNNEISNMQKFHSVELENERRECAGRLETMDIRIKDLERKLAAFTTD